MLREIPYVSFSGHATNASTALYLINKKKPDAVILDINLEEDSPEGNGMNLLITLQKIYPNIKIIMLTNLSHPQYRNRCLNLGASYFLDKTNEFEKLPDTIRLLRSSNHTSE